MRKLFAGIVLMARRFGWITVIPILAVCSADHSTTIVAGPPAAVTNLAVQSTTDNTATLSFTQVEDGMGQPAKYDVRFAPAPISWASAASVASGTCATPLNGSAIGASLACTVQGLSPATEYNFQVVAYRGTLSSQAVIGQVSNVADGTTTGGSNPPPPPPPAPVVTTVSVAPSSASVQVGATTPLSATVKDQNGNTMTGQTVTWSSDKTGIATVNPSGVVSGVAAGSATITASTSGKSGTATITVTAAPRPAPVVTTVTVSPTSVSVQVGSTSNLSATVKDQNGNTMSGQTVTWASDKTNIATVNSSGVVTGVAAGSATISATSSGKSGTAAVTVTAPPPPPPPGGTLLFQENFEDSNLGSRGWYDNTGATLSTTEHIAGSVSSAQYHWLKGATSPQGNGAQRHKFTASNSVYLSYYVKYSANYVGSGQDYHPHEFYFLSTLDADYDGLSEDFMTVYVEQNYLNGGRPVIAMQDNKSINYNSGALPNNLVAVTENRSTAGCNGTVESNMYHECFAEGGGTYYNSKNITGPVVFQPSAGPGYKNDWNFVEAYVQLNTITNGKGNADGVMQYWFNGQLIIDRHDILFRTGQNPTMQLNQLIIAPYIGDGSPADQYMWVDNLRVATGRIP